MPLCRTLASFAALSLASLSLAAMTLTTGCHSATIEAVIRNRTERPIRLVEIDYPTASFGTQDLAPKQDYTYRFKVLGNGGTKVLWTDASGQERTQAGPALREGDEGRLVITFDAPGPIWDTQLTNQGKKR